ncbi:MAG TPA: CU044_5270 family protein [Streptosporangiaceae bacterium]|nr:CU044_5270 family protein [Streptosporangiaceae bacterium]
MNALDELLASTGRVEDITPDGLRNGRAALESTIHDARTQQAPAPERPAAALRSASLRGKIIVACTAAAVAAVAMTVVPGLSSRRPAGGYPYPAQSTAVTAAFVFREAAKAAKAADAHQRGWPHAAYWQADSIEVRAGKTYHRDIWIAHNGDAVLEDSGLQLPPGPQKVSPPGSGFGFLGTKPGWLTWGEIYALPTDPAKLAPLLTRYSRGLAYGSLAKSLWSTVLGLLVETPASPALREALYDVAANIPGVAVNGDYTDSLGRRGTALTLGEETLVIDPANGQLLAWIDADVAYTYTFQGPVNSEP